MQKSRATKKQNQIVWRQVKVLELAADGYSEREVAAHLQLSQPTVHRDLTLLKQQAKEHINKYITEQVPFEYKKTLAGLEGIIKKMSNIISKPSQRAAKIFFEEHLSDLTEILISPNSDKATTLKSLYDVYEQAYISNSRNCVASNISCNICDRNRECIRKEV
jgi:DNA-binding transcriptional regulator LsrR (DeoR family)